MTVTEPTARPWLGSPWTVEDLLDVPDDGLRHELFDGVLQVSPAPDLFHVSTAANLDELLKRYEYARAGIPLYWIVDPEKRTLTVLTLQRDVYVESALVGAGERFTTGEPFPVEFDPGEIF